MRSNRFARQRGIGLVEVLVASTLMAVGVVVLLGSLSSLLLGSRIAERRTAEEGLARTQIEQLMAQDPLVCPLPTTRAVDRVSYTIETICAQSIGYVELIVTVRDPSGIKLSLSNDRVGS